jgi:CIC family chloride channel protein
LTAGPGAFATVGMAALFAGAARAPFTAILIVFEMTDDYRLILPLMVGVVISLIVAEHLQPESIYTLKLARRGIHLRSGRDIDVMESVRVDEVMVSNPVTVPASMPVTLLAGEFLRTGRHGFPVVNPDNSLFGVVSLEDYRRATGRGNISADELIVSDIATRSVVTVYPDETVGVAMRRMAPRDISRLPVVARDNPRQLLGVVRRNDIVRAYEVGALRREEARRRAEIVQDVSDLHAKFIDVILGDGSLAIGRTIAELKLPQASVVVSVRRRHNLIIPHGDTRLESGDIITALCEENSAEEVRSILNETNKTGEDQNNRSPDP